MPQRSHIIGVNSVTNIEPGKGLMPAPLVRNVDWLEKLPRAALPTASFAPADDV